VSWAAIAFHRSPSDQLRTSTSNECLPESER
jgi:hypothetical protein